jgi:hypothetical protein
MSTPGQDCLERDQTAAYVLGALQPVEAERYEEHLRGCSTCVSEVAKLEPLLDLLAADVPQFVAPPSLHERIMATVRSEAELLNAAGVAADRPKITRPRLRLRRLQLAATAIAVGVGVLIGAVAFEGKSSPAPSPSSSAQTTPARLASVPAGAKAFVRQAGGRAELVLSGIPQPPRGKIYEIWKARDGKAPQPTNALFGVAHDGSASVDVPGSLDGVKQVMVTAERQGGSEHPTSSPIIVATLRST